MTIKIYKYDIKNFTVFFAINFHIILEVIQLKSSSKKTYKFIRITR